MDLVTVYKTEDGRYFEERDEAARHEKARQLSELLKPLPDGAIEVAVSLLLDKSDEFIQVLRGY